MHALSVFSLRNRALTALLTVFLMVGGLYAVSTLKRELIPSISFPVMGVVTSVPGAAAGVVEERVTRPMEGAVLGLRGVDKVTSTSSDSLSTVMVTLAYGEDLSKAQNDAQRAILNLRNLPEGATPQVITGSIADFPIIQMSMAGGADQQDLLAKVRAQVVPAIEGIPGVRSVQVSGVADRVVLITVDQAKLAAAKVSPAALTTLLQTNGVTVPAGTVAKGQTQLSVQVGSPITSLEQLTALPLAPAVSSAAGLPVPPTGTPAAAAAAAAAAAVAVKPVTLGDVATVSLASATVTSLSRTDGAPSLTLAITKTPDGNTVAISHELTKLRPDLERMVTAGKTQVVYDQAPFIEESVKDLANEGMLGLAFAVFVVFLFLMSLRLTLVTAVSIPLSLLIALLGLRAGGFTLNILTLGALTIAVGRVVDDSIVVIENIERHLRMGQSRREAIPTAIREVATAVTSSTLATVAVFVPLALVGGQVGELFRPFALTVTMAMVASLFVALTIVPVLGYWFLRDLEVADAVADAGAGEVPTEAADEAGMPPAGLSRRAGRHATPSRHALGVRRSLAARRPLAALGRGGVSATVPDGDGSEANSAAAPTTRAELKAAAAALAAAEGHRGRSAGARLAGRRDSLGGRGGAGGRGSVGGRAAYRDGAGHGRGSRRHGETPEGAVHLPEQDEPVTRLQETYLPTLRWALRRPVVTVLLSFLLLVLSAAGARLLKTDFIGNSGSGTLTISQKLPAGTSLGQMDAAARELEKGLIGRSGVKSYQVTVGSSGPLAAFTGGGANNANFTVTASSARDTDALVAYIRSYADARPTLGTVTVSTGGGPTGASTVQVIVKAPDDATLREAARIMTEQVKKVGGARDVTNDVSALIPTIVVEVDRAKALSLGLSEGAVGGLVASALRGTKLGEVVLNGIAHTVTLKQGVAPADVAALSALPIGAGAGGVPVTLAQVATVKEVQAPASLSRTDGARTATISATPTSDDLGAVTAALTKVVTDTTLPAGATAKVGGVSADQAQAFGQLGLALLVAVAITYAILVATFGSLLQPLVLMVSIPFAATGAIGLLLVTGKPLGVASMIGLLMLVGIVVTNAIVLIDLVNQYRGRGLGIEEAIVEGARHRLRPIVMTALATILALVPMALSITGGGAFISQPLALVVIGGLLSSTVLTLVIVPVLYLLLERARQRRGFGADQRGAF